MFGFECGDGWYDLLFRLFEKIEKHLATVPQDEAAAFDVTQIKEKYGTLRFYFSGGDVIDKFVDEAEAESEKTCENCGKEGRIRSDGWISVRCDQCQLKATAGKLIYEVLGSVEVYDYTITWGEDKGKTIKKVRVAEDQKEALTEAMAKIIAKLIKYDKPLKEEKDV